jgi:hypothetical protein
MRYRLMNVLVLASLSSCARAGLRSNDAIAPLSSSLIVGADTLVLGQPLRHPALAGRTNGTNEVLRHTLPGFREIEVLRRRDTLITIVMHHDRTMTFTGVARAYRATYGAPHETTDNMVAWCTATVRLQVVDWGDPNGPQNVTAVLIDRAGVGLGCPEPPA